MGREIGEERCGEKQNERGRYGWRVCVCEREREREREKERERELL